MLKNEEEDELQKLRQEKSEMEIYIYDLHSKRVRLESDGQHAEQEPCEERNRIPLADDHKKSDDFRLSADYDRREENDTPQNFLSTQSSSQTSHALSNTFHMTSYNSETSINNSHFHAYQPQQVISSETLLTDPLSSPSFYDDCLKVDNDVISLKRERSEIEGQISDLRIQLTRLQAEVSSLENRKTILETMPQKYALDDMKTVLMNGHADVTLDSETTRAITEVREHLKKYLADNYSPQFRRENNTSHSKNLASAEN